MESKPASMLVVPLEKALSGIPPSWYGDRWLATPKQGRITVSKLVVWKANGNLLQGSVNGFKIAPPSSGRGSTSCKDSDLTYNF